MNVHTEARHPDGGKCVKFNDLEKKAKLESCVNRAAVLFDCTTSLIHTISNSDFLSDKHLHFFSFKNSKKTAVPRSKH